MPNPNDIMSKLDEYHDECAAALNPSDLAMFDEARMALAARIAGAAADDGELEAVTGEVLALLQEYPKVDTILRRRAPQLFPAPQPEEADIPGQTDLSSTQSAQPASGQTNPSNPPVSSPPQAAQPASGQTNPSCPARPRPLLPASNGHPSSISRRSRRFATAAIGIIVIGFTAYLALRSVDVAGDGAKSADVQNVLTLMLGLAGVVLGYYFGRIPAEAQATQARKEASTAAAGAEEVGIRAEALADETARALSSEELTRGAALPPERVNALLQARNDLRASLHALSRR